MGVILKIVKFESRNGNNSFGFPLLVSVKSIVWIIYVDFVLHSMI